MICLITIEIIKISKQSLREWSRDCSEFSNSKVGHEANDECIYSTTVYEMQEIYFPWKNVNRTFLWSENLVIRNSRLEAGMEREIK